MNFDPNDRLYRVFLEIYQLDSIKSFAEFFQGELKVLTLLTAYQNENVYPSMLSKELKVTRGRITAILNALKKKGFVVLDRDLKDLRKVRVQASPEGIAYALNKIQVVVGHLEYWKQTMGKDKMDTMCSILEETVAILRKEKPQP